MASLKLKKAYLVGLASWLNELMLMGSDSRGRTKFFDILYKAIEEYDKERNVLIGEVVAKEEDGKTWKKIEAVDNSGERWDIPEDKQPALGAQLLELQNEEWVLDVVDSNRELLKQIKHIILDTDFLFGPHQDDPREMAQLRVRQMSDYPAWCDAFENVDLS